MTDRIAARPIRINRTRAKSLADKALRLISRGFRGQELLGYYTSVNVLGEKVQVPVSLVQTDETPDWRSPRRYVSGGKVQAAHESTKSKKGTPVSLTLSLYRFPGSPSKSKLRTEVFSVLIHELTHVHDILAYNKGQADAASYYNSKTEVRAFMQQIVQECSDEYRKLAEPDGWYTSSLTERLFQVLLNKSPTWDRVQRSLTDKNKRLILKAVVTSIQDIYEEVNKPYRTGARPIKIDVPQIQYISRTFEDHLRYKGSPPKGKVGYGTAYRYTDVQGVQKEVDVLLVGSPHVQMSQEYIVGGYFNPKKGQVVVYSNPQMGRKSFKGYPLLEADLYRILAHELTHAHDHIAKYSKSSRKDYYNQPTEVRALMRDVLTQVQEPLKEYLDLGMVFKVALKYALQDCHKWKRAEPYLTRKSKNTVLKGLITALEDLGYLN